MNVGDLVTLSAYGKSLKGVQTILRRRSALGLPAQLIGLVVQLENRAYCLKYKVRWIGKDPFPTGRDYFGFTGFERKDLKVYKKA